VTAQSPPKAIRFPSGSGLLAWYESYAAREHLSVNAALLRGLAQHRAAVEAALATEEQE
jgi:hypothetical protein